VTGGGYTLNWGMPILVRDSANGSPLNVPLGSSLPRYQVGLTQNVRYKRLAAYGLVDASVGSRIYNQGLAWSLGDFMTGANDVRPGASVESAKPVGYYWRAGPGTGGDSRGVAASTTCSSPTGTTPRTARSPSSARCR
jgi:hypothetical protein